MKLAFNTYTHIHTHSYSRSLILRSHLSATHFFWIIFIHNHVLLTQSLLKFKCPENSWEENRHFKMWKFSPFFFVHFIFSHYSSSHWMSFSIFNLRAANHSEYKYFSFDIRLIFLTLSYFIHSESIVFHI